MTRMNDAVRAAMPGLLLGGTIALAVRFVSDRLGGPAMLYALLFGMAFNFLIEDERLRAAFVLRAAISSASESRYWVCVLQQAKSQSSVGQWLP